MGASALTAVMFQSLGWKWPSIALPSEMLSQAGLDVMSLTQTNERTQAEDDEALLVQRLIALDEDAWSTAYQRYFPSLYRMAYARTLQHGAAEDIASKVFLEAVSSIGRYRYRGVPFRAWLFRIARYEISDFVKLQKRRPQVSIEDAPELAIEINGNIEVKADLNQALELLTETQKNVVVLRFMIGCSLAEVALALDKSIGAIKQLQARALGVLQDALLLGGQG